MEQKLEQDALETAVKKPKYVYTAEELMELNITEIPMLFSPILQTVGVASLCGGSDVGKSYLCLNLALSICTEAEDVLGLKIKRKHGSVIIVCTEDTKEDMCVRLTSMLKGKKIIKGSIRFIFEIDGLEGMLKAELSRQPADLVIIDTLGDLFTKNLNQSIDVRQFFKPYKALAQNNKCLILFNHHIGKGKENNNSPSKNDVLGSQEIESACRTVLMLSKRADSKRVLTVVKGNNIPDELKDKGKILDFDPYVGFTDTGETIEYSKMGSSNAFIEDEDLIQKVIELYPKLGAYTKVAEALRKEGYKKIDKNKVMVIWNKHNPSIPTLEKKDDGQEVDKQEESGEEVQAA